MKSVKSIFLLSFIFSALFFIFGLVTLRHYNVNWDESGHFVRGQAIFRFFTTGEKDYKNLNSTNSRISIYQKDEASGESAYSLSLSMFSHPPLNGILASLSNYIFYQKLGIVGDIESYHLFIVFMSVVVSFLMFFFTAKEYGLFAGLIAYFSLIFYPLFLGESHNNIKDPVETAFYALTIYWFYKGITENKVWQVLLSSFFAGLGLATKFNILFIFIPLSIWLVFYKRSFSSRMNIAFVVAFFIPWIILIASWPALWTNTFTNLLKVFEYYQNIGSIVYQPIEYLTFFGFNTYPSIWIIFTTPIPVLVLSFLGIIYALRNGLKEERKTAILILMWFLVPILRVSVPSAGIYGGARQIMEFIPAMAILSGIGASYIAKQFNNKTIQRLKVVQIGLILLFIPTVLKLISIHPNETVYFNELAGGIKGAYEKKIPSAGNDLGNVYRQGVDWLNLYAEKNAKLSLVVNGTPAIPSIFLRKDISFSNEFWSGEQRLGEYVMNTTEIGWDSVSPEKSQYLENSLVPVYEIKVDDVPILKIWKNSPEYSKR